MQTLFDAVDAITPLDVAQLFNMDLRSMRAPCPFHNGTDRNLGFKRGAKWCHCFVCSQSFGAISLYSQLSGITNRVDTAKAMAADFGIEYADNDPAAMLESKAARNKREWDARLAERGKQLYGKKLDELRDMETHCIQLLNGSELDPNDDTHVDAAFEIVTRLGKVQEEIEKHMALNPVTDEDFRAYANEVGIMNG